MPECIVCKGYYQVNSRAEGNDLICECQRCGADNRIWEEQRSSKAVEQGGIEGLLAFTGLCSHVPLIVVYLSFAVGLIGIGGLWSEIKLEVGLSATFVTAVVALFMVQSIYEGRHSLRENDLLMQCKGTGRGRALKIQVSTQLKALLIPAVIAGLVLLLAYTLVQSNMVWGLSKWVFFEDRDEPEAKPEKEQAEGEEPDPLNELKGRIKRASPLVSLSTYVGLSLGLVYYFSMRAARQYAGYMNQHLPPPIFLQGDLLEQVVQRKAERAMRRPITPQVIGDKLEPRSWVWDEMKRTDDGGIELKAVVKEDYQDEDTIGRWTENTTYIVKANPWSRITSIEQEE